jgi:hypothetical protein
MRTFGMPRVVCYLVLATAVLLLPATARAALITIDFNLPTGTHVTDQYSSQGVVFSGYDFEPRPIVVGIWPWGDPETSGTITLDSYCNGPGYIQATFSVPVDYVSMQYRPFEGQVGDLALELYNAAGTLIGAVSMADASVDTWHQLQLTSTENVAYARFIGLTSDGHYNAVQLDNLTFNAVPEPASLLLLSTGLAILVATRRRGV